MIRSTLLLIACLMATPAIAQQTSVTKLEVVGNHPGRLMKLAIDGRAAFEGRGHLDPPGVTWTLDIAPGETPAQLELTIEPCDGPFKAEIPRNGGIHTLMIQGCEIKVLQG